MKLNIFSICCILFFLACNSKPKNNNSFTEKELQQNIDQKSIKEIKNPQIKFLNEKIKADSLNADLYFTRAKANENLQNFKSAIADYNKAISVNPKEPAFYLNLNQLYIQQKNVVDAINTTSKAIEKLPKNEALNLALAKNYLYLNDPKKTVKVINNFLRVNENSEEAYYYKAIALTELGDTLKAITNLQTSIEQNPDFYDAYMNLGLLCSAKKIKLAEGYFKNAFRIKADSKEALYGLAFYYQNEKQNLKAKETYRKLIDLDKNYTNAYYNLGYIYFQEDSLKKANQHFELSVMISPSFAKGYYMRGLVKEATGNKVEAKKDYNRTLGLDQKFELARRALERLN